MRPKPRGALIGVIFLGLIFTLISWLVAWRSNNARAVARLEKAAHDAGLPMNLEELAATYPPIPDSSNAYVALRNVWASDSPEFWAAFDRGSRELPERSSKPLPKKLPFLGRSPDRIKPSEPLSSEILEITQNLVITNSQRMDGLRAALKFPGFRAPLQFQDGSLVLRPDLSQLKQDANLFQFKAVCAIEAARIDEALDCIETIARFGHCLKTDPFSLGQAVRRALYGMAINTSERLVAQQTLNETQLLRLARIIAELQCMDGLKRSLASERAIFFGFLDSPERTFLLSQDPPSTNSENAESPEKSAARATLGLRMFGALGQTVAEKRLMGETIEQAISCSESPDFAATDQFRTIFADALESARGFPPKPLSSWQMYTPSEMGDDYSRIEARRRCALAALAVERYRLLHDGSLPETLASLPSEILNTELQDPFSKQQLHYKKLASGFVIYSVGLDHKDNDGLITTPAKGPYPTETDIGFAIERGSQ